MTDIKMSDAFDMPVSSEDMAMGYYLVNDGGDEFYKEAALAVTAINAYDDNQERIKTLEHESALLENQLKNALAEIAELKKKARGY